MPSAASVNARWSLDFVSDSFGASRKFRILAVIDDCTRECLCLVADIPRQWKVIQTVREKFTCRICEKISQSPAPFHPNRHLAGWQSVLQADAYGGYNDLYRGGRGPGPVLSALCWSHARRKFFELADIKEKPAQHIRALFGVIEDQQELAKPGLDRLRAMGIARHAPGRPAQLAQGARRLGRKPRLFEAIRDIPNSLVEFPIRILLVSRREIDDRRDMARRSNISLGRQELAHLSTLTVAEAEAMFAEAAGHFSALTGMAVPPHEGLGE